MKNVTILAVLLGVLGSGAYAESAVSDAPELDLTGNSDTTTLWVVPATAIDIENKAFADHMKRKANEAMEKAASAVDKRLKEKLAKELEYAMH